MDRRPVPAPRTRRQVTAVNQPQSTPTSPVSNSPRTSEATAGNQPQSAPTSPVSNSPSTSKPSNGPKPPVPPKKIQVVKDSTELNKDVSAISISDSCSFITKAAGLRYHRPPPPPPSKAEPLTRKETTDEYKPTVEPKHVEPDELHIREKVHHQKFNLSPVSPNNGEHPLKGFSYLAPFPSPDIQYTKEADMKVTQDPGAKSGLQVKRFPDPDNDNSSVNKKSHNQEGPYNMDNNELMQWWNSVEPWEELTSDHLLSKDIEARTFNNTVEKIQKSLHVYGALLTDRGESLQNHVTELQTLADSIDKTSQKVKIAAITGATGAVGGAAAVAAVVGIVLSPITLGASLAVTAAAVGVGVAATGAATGASAAIASKVTNTQDRRKVEKILQDYTSEMADIERCLAFIQAGTEHLRRHDLSTLKGVDADAVKVAKVMEVAGGTSGALGATSRSAGIIEGFATGMDLLFSKKDEQKLKRGKESKFAKKIRTVAVELQSQLGECFKFKSMLEERRNSVPAVNRDME
ncbi:uncharacterized protein LOC134079892 [Sardina pilchardus]|uniref:uncharacterized protein LOC134079892 n=1 Tax=Sardina pilchardus TaxID=27697 RepID=UPI002E150CFF